MVQNGVRRDVATPTAERLKTDGKPATSGADTRGPDPAADGVGNVDFRSCLPEPSVRMLALTSPILSSDSDRPDKQAELKAASVSRA